MARTPATAAAPDTRYEEDLRLSSSIAPPEADAPASRAMALSCARSGGMTSARILMACAFSASTACEALTLASAIVLSSSIRASLASPGRRSDAASAAPLTAAAAASLALPCRLAKSLSTDASDENQSFGSTGPS